MTWTNTRKRRENMRKYWNTTRRKSKRGKVIEKKTRQYRKTRQEERQDKDGTASKTKTGGKKSNIKKKEEVKNDSHQATVCPLFFVFPCFLFFIPIISLRI
jgi:hypothetical protein